MSVLKFRDSVTNEWKEITTIMGPAGPQGEQGKKGDTGEVGPQGPKGDAYVLTEEDKIEIAGMIKFEDASTPKWNWIDSTGDFGTMYVSESGYSQYIIVGYWDSTENMVSYPINMSYSNYFYEESGTKYYVNEPYLAEQHLRSRRIYFENQSGQYLYFTDEDGNNMGSQGFSFLGYYYYG